MIYEYAFVGGGGTIYLRARFAYTEDETKWINKMEKLFDVTYIGRNP